MVTLKINNGNCLLLAWNNGKEVLRLVLTSLTTPGLQIHYAWPHPDSKYTDQSAAAVLCLMSPPANGRHAFTDMCTNCLSDAIIIYLNNSFSLTQQRPICESPSHSSMRQMIWVKECLNENPTVTTECGFAEINVFIRCQLEVSKCLFSTSAKMLIFP